MPPKTTSTTTDALIAALKHEFKDSSLLVEALTHPSLGGVRKVKRSSTAYERLEFLGDRVLGLVIAELLYKRYPDASEGDLAKRHAGLVNRDTLTLVAKTIDLPKNLKVARSEAKTVTTSHTLLGDACEALIGALYLDAGLTVAEAFIHRHWSPHLEDAAAPPIDAKTALQEWAQGRGLPLPSYRVVTSEGPAHAPRFVVEVTIKGHDPVKAEGTSKREAQKSAAAQMIERLKSL